MENPYHNSVIYTIEHNEDKTLLYVGSTIEFEARIRLHKHNCKTQKQKLYQTIRDNGGWDCFTMKIYKQFKCETKREMFMEEELMRLELGATLNMNRAYTTETEHKEQRIEWAKQYYQDKKETIVERNKKYREKNAERLNEIIVCHCGRSVRRHNISKHKRTIVHKEWERSQP